MSMGLEKRLPPYQYCVGRGEFRFITDSATFVGVVEKADWEYTWLNPTLVFEPNGNGEPDPKMECDIPVPVTNLYVRGVIPLSKGYIKQFVKEKRKKSRKSK